MHTSDSKSVQRQRQLEAMDTQIASSEHDIERAKARLIQLRRTRNELVAVSKLPTEVLCSIFKHLRDADILIEDKEDPGTWFRDLHELHWTTVTHVCSQWRQSAVAFSGLWSHGEITDDSVVWMANMLEWSKPGPTSLHLRNDKLSEEDEKVVSLAFTEIERLQSLVIDGPKNLCQRRLAYLPPWTPKLLSLCIRRDVPGDPIDFDFSWLQHGAPSLRTLSLQECNWTSPPLSSSLTRLSISTDLYEIATAQNFLAGLQNLSALHFLRIDSIDFPPLPEPQITWFPNLVNFSAMDDMESLHNFMQHLRVPFSCALTIPLMYGTTDFPGDVSELWIPTLAPLWSMDQQQPTLRSLSLHDVSDGPITYRFWTENLRFDGGELPSPFVKWNLCSALVPPVFTLSTLFNSITSLKIAEVSFSRDTLVLMAGAMPNLKELCLEDCDFRELLTFLDASPSGSSDEPANLWFPALKFLVIESPESGFDETILDLGLLLHVVKGRALRTCRLDKVVLRIHTTLDEPTRKLQLLRDWANEVVWEQLDTWSVDM